MNSNEHKQIALTILAQLGGNEFKLLTGADNFAFDGPSLCFRFKGSRQANYCKVILDPSDTYTVEFWKITRRGLDAVQLRVTEGLYADQLKDHFENVTGLYVTLQPR